MNRSTKSFRRLISAVLVFAVFFGSASSVFAGTAKKVSVPLKKAPVQEQSQKSDKSSLIKDLSKNIQTVLDKNSKTDKETKDINLNLKKNLAPPAFPVGENHDYKEKKAIVKETVNMDADSSTGALVIDFPLVFPPGRNGMEPDLSLNYNSQQQNSDNIFGHGWDINIPYIERINKLGVNTLYSKNFFQSSLTGELAEVSLSDGTHGSYGSKIENGDFLKYDYKTNNSWEVTAKDGMIYKFGITTGARQDNPGNNAEIYKWMLEEVRDTNNNFIKYEYSKDSGQIYPAVIKYTGFNNIDGNFKIEFRRAWRPDYPTSYKTGFKVTTKYRIDLIQAFVNSISTKWYFLRYTTGDNLNVSLLGSIEESGKEGDVTTNLSPNRFTYQQDGNTGGWQYSTYNSIYTVPVDLFNGPNEESGARIVDVNGDGLEDIVYAKENYPRKVYINDGGRFGWQEANGYYVPVDFVNNGWDKGVRIADVNGDGLQDLLQSPYGSTGIVYLNKGDGTGWQSNSNYRLPVNFLDNYGGDAGVQVADINGDGLPDLIKASRDVRVVYFNKGNGTGWGDAVSYAIPLGFDTPGTRLSDVNGDGLVDLLYYDRQTYQAVYINTGKGFEKDSSYNIPVPFSIKDNEVFGDIDNGVRIEDVNGDNLPDLLYARDNDWNNRKVYLNKGDGTGWAGNSTYIIPQPFLIEYGIKDNGIRLADVNGDGLTDFLFRNDRNGNENKVYLNTGKTANLLFEFYNSKGGMTQVNYIATANGLLFNPKLPFVLQTVRTITRWNGISEPSVTTYEYRGGKYYYNNEQDRKFAGFNSITKIVDYRYFTKDYYHQGDSTDSSHGEYNDHSSKIGKISSTERYDYSNQLYSKEINKWENVTLGTGRNFVKLTASTKYLYNSSNNYVAQSENYTYDNTNGNITEKTTLGEVTASANGETIQDIGNDKYSTSINYASSNVITGLPSQEITKDQNNQKISETKYYYDNSSSLGYVAKGNLTKQEMWKSGNSYVSIEKKYNDNGLITEEKDPRGKRTLYSYDFYNLYPTTVTNAANQTTTYSYDYSSGKIKEAIDPNGRKFQTIYDGLDRVKEQKQPDFSNPNNLVTKTLYSYNDTAFPSYVYEWNKVEAASRGPINYTYFDGFGRVIQERREAEDPNIFSVKDYTYDKRGLVEKESLPYFSTGEGRTSATTDNTFYIKYIYDSLSRIKTVTNSIGSTNYSYDGWKTTITDAKNNTKDLYSDVYENLIKVAERNEGNTYITEYKYDGLKNLINIKDAQGNIRNFTYDNLGRQLSAEDLHSQNDNSFGTWSSTYDDAGNLLSQTDPKSQTITYSYDDINRILKEKNNNDEVFYTYDNCKNGIGRLCAISDKNILTVYQYNPVGFVEKESRYIDAVNYLTKFNYDFQGNVTSIVYPDPSATTINYTYNTTAKIKSIQQNGNNVVANINYAATGEIAKIDYANGTSSENIFDSQKLYRLTNKTTKKGTAYIQNISYNYDEVGNITKITDSSPSSISKIANFQYDNLYRLKSAVIENTGNSRNYTQTYQYDSIGNITNKSDQGNYSYAGNQGDSYATPHAVTSVGATNFSYDRNGNLLSDGKQTLTWDYKNRLAQAATPSGTVQYAYDNKGERIKQNNGSVTTIYPNKFYEIRGNATTKQIYIGGDLVASIRTGDQSNNVITYEDAEDGNTAGWSIVNPGDATIENISENAQQGKVILLKGTGVADAYRLNNADGSQWNNATNKFIKFDVNFTEDFTVRLAVNTNAGYKYVAYSTSHTSAVDGDVLYVNLGAENKDGNWHTITRDIQADINSVQPGASLVSINFLNVWGHGKVDNIKFLQSLQETPPYVVNGIIYHHDDHLSGTNIETDQQGNVIETVDYYPFGEVRTDEKTTAYKNPYKFTGKELDVETGLYYYSARYYNPAIGRFISMDTWGGDIKDPQSLNRYSYVRNNPLRYTDPTGKYFAPIEMIAKSYGNPDDYDWYESYCYIHRNDINYSSRGMIDDSGNIVTPDFSRITDTEDIVSAGITFAFGWESLSKPLITRPSIGNGIFKKAEALEATQSGKKPIIIGESMDRVKDVAGKTGLDYYKSRPANPANYMENNKNWIQRQIENGRKIFDIGRDPVKVSKNKPIGEYYKMEKGIIKKNNYPIKKLKIK